MWPLVGLAILAGALAAPRLWRWLDARLLGAWTESYETIAREERPSMWDKLFGARDPEEGTVRELPAPQVSEQTYPTEATHAIYQGGRWLPAAGEPYADGRIDIIPLVQWAEEEA